MILVLGSVLVRPEHKDQALTLSQQHVRRSRTEPGCLSHDVHLDLEDSRRLVFVERWQDHDSLMRHFAVEESKSFVKAIRDMAIEDPSIEIFEATPTS